MLPFGPRLTTVFASRWKALFWAAGVMVTAYFTATEAKHDTPGETPVMATTAATPVAAGASQASPWAK